jgi:hypothetical protein
LQEGLRSIAPRFGYKAIHDLVKAYPKITLRDELEGLLLDIGLEQFGFNEIRDKHSDFAEPYGIPPLPQPAATASPTPGTSSATATTPANSPSTSPQPSSTLASNTTSSATQPTSSRSSTPRPKARATDDAKYVASLLRNFSPSGTNRQKVVTLRDEIKRLKINENPIAFCLLLRSLFEI